MEHGTCGNRLACDCMRLNLGDVPTWLATIGAAVAAYFAARAYLAERRRDDVAADILRQEQASQVAVWTEYRDHPHTGEPEAADCFRFRNASQLPIYDVCVFSYSYDKSSDFKTAVPVGRFRLGTIPPSPDARLRIAYLNNRCRWAFAIEFRDAAGVVWYRDLHGVLRHSKFPDFAQFKDSYTIDDL